MCNKIIMISIKLKKNGNNSFRDKASRYNINMM